MPTRALFLFPEYFWISTWYINILSYFNIQMDARDKNETLGIEVEWFIKLTEMPWENLLLLLPAQMHREAAIERDPWSRLHNSPSLIRVDGISVQTIFKKFLVILMIIVSVSNPMASSITDPQSNDQKSCQLSRSVSLQIT